MSEIKVYEDLCLDEVRIEKIKFVWDIKSSSKRNGKMTSTQFPTSAPENLGKWRLELNLNDADNATSPEMSDVIHQIRIINAASIEPGISIRLNQENHTVSSAKVTFTILRNERIPVSKEIKYGKKGCLVEFEELCFLRKNDMDELKIVCEIEIQVNTQNHSTSKFQLPPCRLAEDLGYLLSSKSLSDVSISVGGVELRAHKAILAARSPVFANMFNNELLEKESSIEEITDIDPDVFQEMLEFMYTGKEILQTSRAHDLLAAATRYQLNRLKVMCEEALCKALSVDNVLHNFALADLYNAPRLKDNAVRFVMEHKSEVFGNSSWDILKRTHQSLVMEILEKICLQEKRNTF